LHLKTEPVSIILQSLMLICSSKIAFIATLDISAEEALSEKDKIARLCGIKKPKFIKAVRNTKSGVLTLKKMLKKFPEHEIKEIHITNKNKPEQSKGKHKQQEMMLIFFGTPPYISCEDNLSAKYDFPLACAPTAPEQVATTIAHVTASLLEQGVLPIKWIYLPHNEEVALYFKERATNFIARTNHCLDCAHPSNCGVCNNNHFSEYATLLQKKGIGNLSFNEREL